MHTSVETGITDSDTASSVLSFLRRFFVSPERMDVRLTLSVSLIQLDLDASFELEARKSKLTSEKSVGSRCSLDEPSRHGLLGFTASSSTVIGCRRLTEVFWPVPSCMTSTWTWLFCCLSKSGLLHMVMGEDKEDVLGEEKVACEPKRDNKCV